jgi:hypothetical protein
MKKRITTEDKDHLMKCDHCHEVYDRRDITQVLTHIHRYIPDIEFVCFRQKELGEEFWIKRNGYFTLLKLN